MENQKASVKALERLRDKRKQPGQTAIWLISAAGVLAMTALFVFWWRAHYPVGFLSWLSAFLCAALFTVLGLRFVPHWVHAWQRDTPDTELEKTPAPVGWRELVRAFFLFMAADAALILLLWLLQIMTGSEGSFYELMFDLWNDTDGEHYMDIARDGYLSEGDKDRLVQLVFLPAYPLLMRFFALFTGDYLYAGMLASGLCFAGAGVMLYSLARLDMDEDSAQRVLKYTCLCPAAFFFTGVMSESLFFLLCLSCVYLARKKRWLAACLVGALASFTRTLGLVLLAPVCFELIADTVKNHAKPGRRVCSFACLFLIPLGFFTYCWINYRVSGDWFKFMEYERDNWYQSMGLFFNTASYQVDWIIKKAQESSWDRLFGLWIPGLLCHFVSLGIMIPSVRRMRPSYGAYFIGYYVMAMGATWLLSGPRYLAACFPLSFALSSMTKNREADSLVTILLTAFTVLYAFAFVQRWQVW